MSYVNAASFGLHSRNTGTENQKALQAAVDTKNNVFIPEGVYDISGSLKMKENGQSIFGYNKWSTVLKVESSKENLSEFHGTLDTNGMQYAAFRNFQIEFEQNINAVSRSELIDFNPGIYVDAPRAIIEDVTISKASTGVKAVGNFGGLTAQDLEVGALDYGIDLGHSDEKAHAKDTVHLDNVRVWPHKMHPNLTDIYYDGDLTGIGIGNIDDFKGSDLHTFRSKIEVGGEHFFGQITGLTLDGERAKLIVDGKASLQVTGMYNAGAYKSPVFSQNESLVVVNGDARVAVDGYELNTAGLSTSLVKISSANAVVTFSNGIVDQPHPNGQAFLVTNGHLSVHNTVFVVDNNNSPRNKYMIEAKGAGAVLAVTGSVMQKKPDDQLGNGGFIKTTNAYNDSLIANNSDGGWGVFRSISADDADRGIGLKAGSSSNEIFFGSRFGDQINGQSGDDTIHGSAGADTLLGSSGNDELYGSIGKDEARGGKGNDEIFGGDDADKLYGGTGSDLANGGASADRIWGQGGHDVLNGSAGNDTIWGGVGADRLGGGSGADALKGGAGSDIIRGGDGADDLNGGSGNDVLHGDDGDDQISGGVGHDTLVGEFGDDTLMGHAGNDLLIGQIGNDFLQGGRGADTLYGGLGSDTFYFDARSDRITINDYQKEVDIIAINSARVDINDLREVKGSVLVRIDDENVLRVREAKLEDVVESIEWI